MSTHAQVRIFVAVAITEAVSWVGLLTGMYFKYVADAGELGVEVFGPVHGVVFLGYVAMTLLLARTLRWSVGTTLAGLACSIPPFATVVFERWAQRTGRLSAPAVDAARQRVDA